MELTIVWGVATGLSITALVFGLGILDVMKQSWIRRFGVILFIIGFVFCVLSLKQFTHYVKGII